MEKTEEERETERMEEGGEREREREQMLYSVAIREVKRDGELQRGSETEITIVDSVATSGVAEEGSARCGEVPPGAILPSSVRSVQYAPSG